VEVMMGEETRRDDGRAVLGVDPGFSGGFAWLAVDGSGAGAAPMPVHKGKGRAELDVPGLVALVRSVQAGHAVALAVVERVHAMPRQGLASTFAFGRGFGEVLGALKALGLPLELPTPQAWRRVVLAGTPGGKLASIQYARRRFPQVPLLATPRSRTPHDGMAEALLMCEYGRRLLVGGGAGR
jgi:crossover junction endodeoxyribonuclease RuvC